MAKEKWSWPPSEWPTASERTSSISVYRSPYLRMWLQCKITCTLDQQQTSPNLVHSILVSSILTEFRTSAYCSCCSWFNENCCLIVTDCIQQPVWAKLNSVIIDWLGFCERTVARYPNDLELSGNPWPQGISGLAIQDSAQFWLNL